MEATSPTVIPTLRPLPLQSAAAAVRDVTCPSERVSFFTPSLWRPRSMNRGLVSTALHTGPRPLGACLAFRPTAKSVSGPPHRRSTPLAWGGGPREQPPHWGSPSLSGPDPARVVPLLAGQWLFPGRPSGLWELLPCLPCEGGRLSRSVCGAPAGGSATRWGRPRTRGARGCRRCPLQTTRPPSHTHVPPLALPAG